MTVELPDRGFVFWPVGCGDSTTIKVNDNVVVQVDIQHHESAEADDEPYHPVVDTLVDEVLPEVDGEKYLAVFALTHPDKDHCKGFAELLERCKIGELWFTPRIIREYADDEGLSEDAKKFCEEANRRIELNQSGEAESGDRIRIIGNDDILDEDDYKDIPDDCKSRPGESTTVLDGIDLAGTFRAFFHAPFGDDSDGNERNKTSLAMQITLTEGDEEGRLMLFGDLDYPPLKRIFDYSDDDDKAWDVFLAPHHCSKSAMYFQEEGDDEPVCQGPVGSARWRTVGLPVRGQQNCPVVARCSARSSVGQWRYPLAGGGLGEADAVAGGHDDVGVVQEPVDGGVGDGLGHEFVEPGGVKVARQGDGALLVGGVDDAVERLGGLGGDRQ